MIFKNKANHYSSLTCGLVVSSLFLVGCNNDSKDNTKTTPVIQPQPLEVNLLHINDSHSHLDEESTKLNLSDFEKKIAQEKFMDKFSKLMESVKSKTLNNSEK